MISIVNLLYETNVDVLQFTNTIKNSDFKDENGVDELDQILTNKNTASEGIIDPKSAPPNPEVTYLYVNTPLIRITKTRI